MLFDQKYSSISTRLPEVCSEVLVIVNALPILESGSKVILVAPSIEPVLVIPELLLSVVPDTVKDPPILYHPSLHLMLFDYSYLLFQQDYPKFVQRYWL